MSVLCLLEKEWMIRFLQTAFTLLNTAAKRKQWLGYQLRKMPIISISQSFNCFYIQSCLILTDYGLKCRRFHLCTYGSLQLRTVPLLASRGHCLQNSSRTLISCIISLVDAKYCLFFFTYMTLCLHYSSLDLPSFYLTAHLDSDILTPWLFSVNLNYSKPMVLSPCVEQFPLDVVEYSIQSSPCDHDPIWLPHRKDPATSHTSAGHSKRPGLANSCLFYFLSSPN